MKKTSLAALAAALALAACGVDPSPVADPVPVADPYVLAVPSPAALAIDFDAAIPATTASSGLSVATASALSSPEELGAARAASARMDEAFAIVTRLTPPAGSPARDVRPGVRAFGPSVRCAVATDGSPCPAGAEVESELVVREGDAGLFTWTIRVRGLGAGDDGWFNVFFGRIAPGATEGSREGGFVLSLDQLRQIAWSLPGSGRLIGGYALRPDCRAFMYRAETLELGDAPAVNGRLFVQRCADGTLRVRFSGVRDVLPGVGGSELVTDHVGMTSQGGVAYTLVANWNPGFGYRGDVPWTEWPGEAFVLVRSCLGADRAPLHREAFTCRTDASIADCLASEPTALPGFEGGSWDACSALADAPQTRAPESATASVWDESPEAGFVAPPAPPAYPAELESELGI